MYAVNVETHKKNTEGEIRVNQGYFVVAFPTGWDSATFRDKGTEVSSLSWDKGTMGQAKNLAKGRDGPGQPKSILSWNVSGQRVLSWDKITFLKTQKNRKKAF